MKPEEFFNATADTVKTDQPFKVISSPSSQPLSPDQRVNTALKIESHRGVFGEALPAAFATGGAIIGGALGAPVGGIGAVPGTITGATIGGAVGESIQQWIEKSQNLRTQFDLPQVGKTAVTMGAMEVLFPPILKVGGALAKPITAPVKGFIIKIMGHLSGYAEDVLKTALERTSGAVKGATEGESALSDVVRATAKGLQTFTKNLVDMKNTVVNQLTKLSAGGAGNPGTRRSVLEEGVKFSQNTTNFLREDFNIGVDKAGQLNFRRPVQPSNIVSHSDQQAIQESFDLMNSIKNNTSIKNIDAILERMITLLKKTPEGSPTGPETKLVINRMMKGVDDFVNSLGQFSDAYGQYSTFIKENIPLRIFSNNARDFFGTGTLSPQEASQVSMRLLRIFNTGRLELKGLSAETGQKVGQDIVGTTAGTLIKTGKEVQIESSIPTTRGLIAKAIEWLPRQIIKEYVKTGKLQVNHPIFTVIAKGLGITTETLIRDITGVLQEKKTGGTLEI